MRAKRAIFALLEFSNRLDSQLINNLIVDMERISDRKDRESNENTRVEATANGVF